MTNAFLRLCDYVFVLRPLILIPAWSLFLIGAADGSGDFGFHRSLPLSPVLVSLTAILVVAYLLNQIFDRESDERNQKIFYLSRGLFSERRLIVIAAVFFIVASISFRRAPAAQQVLLVLALLLSLVYSLPPIRLCARPFADLAANAIGYGGIAFVLGYGAYDAGAGDAVRAAAPYALLVAATFLHTAILDVNGDRDAGKISSAVFLGVHASARVAVLLHGLALTLAFATMNVPAVIVAGVTLPLSVRAAIEPSRTVSSLQVQVTTLAVTAVAVVAWPWYLTLIAPLVLLSRYYYRKRFGIIYPGPQRSA